VRERGEGREVSWRSWLCALVCACVRAHALIHRSRMKERMERRGTHLSAERNEGLDEHCRLGGHVQAAGDAGSLRERKVQRRTSGELS
jgi:hypothetical protein